MIPGWLKPILSFFGGLAWVGLVLSILSHLAGLLGSKGPLGDYAWVLHIGIFVVWLPTVLVSSRMGADVKRKDLWAIFLIAAPKGGSGPMIPDVVRGFSGHWMAFYSAAAAVLYSATHANDQDQGRRCVNGHSVGPLARFCEQCGQVVIER